MVNLWFGIFGVQFFKFVEVNEPNGNLSIDWCKLLCPFIEVVLNLVWAKKDLKFLVQLLNERRSMCGRLCSQPINEEIDFKRRFFLWRCSLSAELLRETRVCNL